jgi:hypothetical protein
MDSHTPSRWTTVTILTLSLLVAVVGTRDWAGGWNDSSRLATVECLGDHGTLIIDEAVYVRAAESAEPPGHGQPPIRTKDRLFIDGHYYSDKSPVPALLMVGPYQVWKWVGGCPAREALPSFVYWMTLCSSGLAYIAAVWCVFRIGVVLGLRDKDALLLTVSFALATVAPVYERQVNNHILLLAVAAALLLCLVRLAQTLPTGRVPWSLVIGAGCLAGLGYAIDLGAGPPLLACTLALVTYRCRSWRPLLATGLAALPWLVLHHAVNYATGGTLKPANAVPEYLAWPGSPFDAHNMTGMLNHPSVLRFVLYSLDLLVGQRGFLGHNLALLVAVAVLPRLLWRAPAELPELLFAVTWSGGTWLLYALNSTNHSGLCCSVRWLVPLLAPGYFVLALVLRYCPQYRGDVWFLSGWGALVTVQAWWRGPWQSSWLAFYWTVQVLALLSWLGYRLWLRRRSGEDVVATPDIPRGQPLAA